MESVTWENNMFLWLKIQFKTKVSESTSSLWKSLVNANLDSWLLITFDSKHKIEFKVVGKISYLTPSSDKRNYQSRSRLTSFPKFLSPLFFFSRRLGKCPFFCECGGCNNFTTPQTSTPQIPTQTATLQTTNRRNNAMKKQTFNVIWLPCFFFLILVHSQ